jgi:hypothetical protein
MAFNVPPGVTAFANGCTEGKKKEVQLRGPKRKEKFSIPLLLLGSHSIGTCSKKKKKSRNRRGGPAQGPSVKGPLVLSSVGNQSTSRLVLDATVSC